MDETTLKILSTILGNVFLLIAGRYVKNKEWFKGSGGDNDMDLSLPTDDTLLEDIPTQTIIEPDAIISIHTEKEYLKQEIEALSDEIKNMLMSRGADKQIIHSLEEENYELKLENADLSVKYEGMLINNSTLKGERLALLNRIDDMKLSIKNSHALTYELITGRKLEDGHDGTE